tara:strand:- start:891 stop:1085 length:195 start_codon:yes stop_codon:yes gene_type:complete
VFIELTNKIKMKKQSEHKFYKELKREVVHKEWLLKNLPKSKQARDNQKRILQLLTKIKCEYKFG